MDAYIIHIFSVNWIYSVFLGYFKCWEFWSEKWKTGIEESCLLHFSSCCHGDINFAIHQSSHVSAEVGCLCKNRFIDKKNPNISIHINSTKSAFQANHKALWEIPDPELTPLERKHCCYNSNSITLNIYLSSQACDLSLPWAADCLTSPWLSIPPFKPISSLSGVLCPINKAHSPQMLTLLLCLFVPYSKLDVPLIHICPVIFSSSSV